MSAFRLDGGQHVMLGDFTGHGVSAAIGGPLVTDIFHTQTWQGISLGVICEKLNTKLCTILRVGMFMAGGFLELNPARTELLVWNCGLPDLFIFRDNRFFRRIPSRFFPRGVCNKLDGNPDRVATQPGDRVFIYSDGIIEARNANCEEFGQQRMQAALEQMISQNQSLDVVKEIMECFRDSDGQDDDISIVELTC